MSRPQAVACKRTVAAQVGINEGSQIRILRAVSDETPGYVVSKQAKTATSLLIFTSPLTGAVENNPCIIIFTV